MPRPVTFLSDYGRDDDFVGVCHAVMAKLVPDLRIIDLTHGLPRQAVLPAAVVLARSLPYAAPGVHLAVVDPGVGTGRRPVAVRLADEERVLVGPDNGVLSLACRRFGGGVEAVDLSLSPLRLEPLSATFHGRDLFAPVAAHLAAGSALHEAGEGVDPAGLASVELPPPRIGDEALTAHATYVDGFGNVALHLSHDEAATIGLRLGDQVEIEVASTRFLGFFARTFADVEAGEILLYEDSYWTLALAINGGHAGETLRLEPGAAVGLAPAR